LATDTETVAAFAITQTLKRGLPEITPDELLTACLLVVSQFGIAQIGQWEIDVESLGIEWLETSENSTSKVAYSDASVEIFDRAARIAKSSGSSTMRLPHLLAAFAGRDAGLMGDLKQTYGITNAGWRAAIARMPVARAEGPGAVERVSEYLSPEEAAEALGIHVQTLRGYVRSGKLPARRLAGERAIRIRRSDLDLLLEPLHGRELQET